MTGAQGAAPRSERNPMTTSNTRRYAAVSAICLAWLVLSGCGYALAGRGSFLPEYIRTIGVPLLVNNTTAFDVEQALTSRVRTEFISRGKYKVIPETTGADAVLTGEISAISIQPTAFNDQQQATRYVVVMVVKMEFRDVLQNRVLWENPSLMFREEYDLIIGHDGERGRPVRVLRRRQQRPGAHLAGLRPHRRGVHPRVVLGLSGTRACPSPPNGK